MVLLARFMKDRSEVLTKLGPQPDRFVNLLLRGLFTDV